MAMFSCPECGALSHSNRKATYYWCACGRTLTAADAVPGMAESAAEPNSSKAVPEPEPAPKPRYVT